MDPMGVGKVCFKFSDLLRFEMRWKNVGFNVFHVWLWDEQVMIVCVLDF